MKYSSNTKQWSSLLSSSCEQEVFEETVEEAGTQRSSTTPASEAATTNGRALRADFARLTIDEQTQDSDSSNINVASQPAELTRSGN